MSRRFSKGERAAWDIEPERSTQRVMEQVKDSASASRVKAAARRARNRRGKG